MILQRFQVIGGLHDLTARDNRPYKEGLMGIFNTHSSKCQINNRSSNVEQK